MQFTSIVNGAAVKGTVTKLSDDQYQAVVGERTYSFHATPSEPGIYWVLLEGQSIEVIITPSLDGYVVSIGPDRFDVRIEDERAALRRSSRQGHDGLAEIKAPMPGKIVRVLANDGDSIEANQGVVIMEAMKMQNEIRSPKSGTLKRVHVAAGSPVNAGDLLFAVE